MAKAPLDLATDDAAADTSAKADTKMTDVKTPAADKKATSDQDMVDCVATASFFQDADRSGNLLQKGDKFSTERSRAVELRAGGLIAYADEAAEKEAAADDPDVSTDNGQPVITTRSFRSLRRPA